jgi:hypothetical protein
VPGTPRTTREAPGSVEDFEAWRKRHQAEQASVGATVTTLDEAARARTDGMTRARRNELADLQEEAADPFPWRKHAWLARLLGVPETPATAGRR